LTEAPGNEDSRSRKKKIKKLLTNQKQCDRMNELPLRESTTQNLENRRSNSMQDPENSKRKGEV
jgi:hypothetical protein